MAPAIADAAGGKGLASIIEGEREGELSTFGGEDLLAVGKTTGTDVDGGAGRYFDCTRTGGAIGVLLTDRGCWQNETLLEDIGVNLAGGI